MRPFFQYLFRRPVIWLSNRFNSKPDKERIYNALTSLYNNIVEGKQDKGLMLPLNFHSKVIIFSDQHKGCKNGADDFKAAAGNYIAALEYYNRQEFLLVNLGDCEELWENLWMQVKRHNQQEFLAEKQFLERNAFIKIFGNHDLYWDSDPVAKLELELLYGAKIKAYEGVVLSVADEGKTLNVFCTHGHQGDERSDGSGFSKFFVSRIWAPLQAFLRINTNEPSNDDYKKTLHNEIMYEWSANQQDAILITGHTHQPVFESLTHIERLYKQMDIAKKHRDEKTIKQVKEEIKTYESRFNAINFDYANVLPYYFNSGCCCFSDGDITGIEIESGKIRLIKWEYSSKGSQRIILEEDSLQKLMNQI